jgi:hypothetical protein
VGKGDSRTEGNALGDGLLAATTGAGGRTDEDAVGVAVGRTTAATGADVEGADDDAVGGEVLWQAVNAQASASADTTTLCRVGLAGAMGRLLVSVRAGPYQGIASG